MDHKEETVLIPSELPKYGFRIINVEELRIRSVAADIGSPDNDQMDDFIQDLASS
jgi:hypothetical protein